MMPEEVMVCKKEKKTKILLHALACLKTQLLLIIVFSPWCKESIYQLADICRSFGFLQLKMWMIERILLTPE